MTTKRKARKSKDRYTIGYGRPPREHQFKSGQSGNPRGRPKGIKSLGTILTETLQRRVTVTEHGKPRRMRVQDVIIQGIVNDAARRDPRAVRLLFALMDRFQDNTESQVEGADFAAEDQAIIERFLKEQQSKDGGSHPPPPSGRRRRKRLSDIQPGSSHGDTS